MKAKEKAEKQLIKLRFAVALNKALQDSVFDSARQLALNIGFEPAHIQRIAAGKVDIAISTIVSLSEGLDLSYTEFARYYDGVDEKDILDFVKAQEKRKRKVITRKSSNIHRKSRKKK